MEKDSIEECSSLGTKVPVKWVKLCVGVIEARARAKKRNSP
jgi:hypothetical protein